MKALLPALALLLAAVAPVRADGGRVFVTGYTCDPAHGQPYCGLTADGTQVGPGVAACPSAFAFGTVLRIADVGDVGAGSAFLPFASQHLRR